MPFAYTEEGISMLASVLRSDVAIRVSIGIMRSFVELRKMWAGNRILTDRINEIEIKQLEYQKSSDEKFDKIFEYISEHEEDKQVVFFDGKILSLTVWRTRKALQCPIYEDCKAFLLCFEVW